MRRQRPRWAFLELVLAGSSASLIGSLLAVPTKRSIEDAPVTVVEKYVTVNRSNGLKL
ncbi:hypothetical protein [Rhizobium sp. Rhizsp42]|uniref:hypothetical protein n=1 Tax=Rhizobium sp. Rhizsp42 TaxID=3243034 RepID=UPI0039AF6CD6